MIIEYDNAKDKANQAKHGISLAAAKLVDWDNAFSYEDKRFAYGEVRMHALAFLEAKLMSIIYVDHEDHLRVISMRKASKKEYKDYGNYYRKR